MSYVVIVSTQINYVSMIYQFELHFVCRLFSDGGNYCPEEVELFTKRLVSITNWLHSYIVV